MSSLIKIGLGILTVFGLYKGYKAYSANSLSEKLEIKMLNPRVHQVAITGVEIRTGVQIQNPTKQSMTLTQPFVKITARGSVIATSVVSDKEHEIKGMSNIDLDTISLKIKWIDIIQLLSALKFNFPANSSFVEKVLYLISNYKEILSHLDLNIQYSTYANGIFYRSTPEKIISNE